MVVGSFYEFDGLVVVGAFVGILILVVGLVLFVVGATFIVCWIFNCYGCAQGCWNYIKQKIIL